jgi:hypothetical protein
MKYPKGTASNDTQPLSPLFLINFHQTYHIASNYLPAIKMYEMESSVIINAPFEKVWSIVSDLPGWSRWNSMITVKLHSSFTQGAEITITVESKPGATPGNYKNTLKKIDSVSPEMREIIWGGVLYSKLILHTHRYLRVYPIGNGETCRFVQGEAFMGSMVPVMKLTGLFKDFEESSRRMDNDLKRFAEA